MNNQEMLRIIDSIARDRNVERDLLIADLEQAMVSAARKHYNSLDAEEFACHIDRIEGGMRLTRHGEPLDLSPEVFGRIAAQTFKQVMIQKFREDERASIYDQFIKRVGELVTGTVQRYEGGAVVITVDRAEAFMPRSEQIPGEQFYANDRVRCLVLDVRAVGNQVKIVLSRAHPDFIKNLFEVEVPEVAERVIEIKAMAREAGHRTKVAVSSIDSKVDAVGACVGVRGSRIKNIVDELNGEKIDIVRWNESSQILIQNALKPAEIAEVSLCFELGRATVVVDETQLSLAIGKRGQNVRLAARLTGWDVDILTPAEFNKGLENMAEALKQIEGITEEMLDRLAALGMISVYDIEDVGAEVLVTELEIDRATADRAVEIASARAKELTAISEKEKAEAEARKAEEEEAARKLLEEGGEAGEVDEDLAAAAILGIGGSTPPPAASDNNTDADTPATDQSDDARAAAILSGAEPPTEPAEVADDAVAEPTPADEPAASEEPQASDEPAPGFDLASDKPSDPGDPEGADITENAIEEAAELPDEQQEPREQHQP